ncbi:MAG: hypothetical protein P8M22_08880 [Phycisphaerales bacterium]|nr:hypothetical protein [Phycisphaerales bacterium]
MSRAALPVPGKGGMMEDRLSQTDSEVGGGGSEPRKTSAPRASEPGTDVLGILGDIESQFDRLRNIRGDQISALRELAERSARLEEKKSELDTLQSELQEMKQTWDRTRQHEQQALSESQQCLEADRESHTRRIEEDKATLIRDRSSLDDDRDRMQRENDSQRSHFDKTRCKMDALQDSLDARSREIEDAALAVSEQDALLKQQVVEQKLQEEQWLDALRVARKTVSRRGKQIARQEMETRKLRSLRDSLKTRRRGLESAARVYRCKLEELEEKVDLQDARLEEAGRRLLAFMEQLREQTDLVERGNAALALVDQLEGRIDELQEALADAGDSAETSARITALEAELDSARCQLADVEPAMQELEGLRESHSSQEQDIEIAVENRTRRLADIARHLHTRRTRLHSLRKAMRVGNSPAASETSKEQVSQRLRQSEIIEQRQRELDDVQRMLASSEKKMIKRWAAPRTLVLTSWTLLLVVIIAAASWVSADRVRPAVRTASVALAPQVPPGSSMDEASSNAWLEYHESQLKNKGFIREVTRRSSGRRLSPWDSHESVSRLLQKNLVMDTGEPERMVLTIAANDSDRAAAFLDILATSMVLDSQRSIASRPSGHASKVLDDRTDGGVLRYARIDPSPVQDDRLVTASLFFAGGLLLTFMVMGVVYTRLIRAKRIFEQIHPDDLGITTAPVRPI